jgi:predicted deacylase
VVALPAVNVTAFRGNTGGGGIRNSPADLDGGIAFPRQYPGNPNGGFTAQSAAAIWDHLVKYANYFITCHGSGEMFGVDRVLLFKSDAPSYAQAAELAKAMKMEIVLTAGGDPKRGKSAIELLLEKGIPSISVESNGGAGGIGLGWESDTIKSAILNGMKHLKMIDGSPDYLDRYTYVHYEKGSGGIFPHRGGFFRPLVKVKERVKEGQDVGTIYNFFEEEVERIKSPVNGIVLGYWGKCPQIGSGQYRVFEIAVPNEGQ